MIYFDCYINILKGENLLLVPETRFLILCKYYKSKVETLSVLSYSLCVILDTFGPMHMFEKRHSRVFLTAMTKVSFQNCGTRVFRLQRRFAKDILLHTAPTFILRHVFLTGLFLQLSNVNSWKSLVMIILNSH